MTRTTYSTSMNKEEINNDVTILFKIVDKLEQRISKLEKVLESHAKCIGRLAHEKENKKDD
jgi:exonuclease VII small subunit